MNRNLFVFPVLAPSFKLLFVDLMPGNADWIHSLHTTMRRWILMPARGLFPCRALLLMQISIGCYIAARACAFEHRIAGWIL